MNIKNQTSKHFIKIRLENISKIPNIMASSCNIGRFQYIQLMKLYKVMQE